MSEDNILLISDPFIRTELPCIDVSADMLYLYLVIVIRSPLKNIFELHI